MIDYNVREFTVYQNGPRITENYSYRDTDKGFIENQFYTEKVKAYWFSQRKKLFVHIVYELFH